MSKSKKISYPFLLCVLALLAIGILMVFSASPTMGLKHGDTLYYIKRHFLYLILGFFALYYGFYIDLDYLKNKALPVLLVSAVLLILVFIPGVGRKVLGASRWIDLGILSFQPSELIKFSIVLFSAKWLSENADKTRDFLRVVLPLLICFGAIFLLIMKQPDMGTAITIGSTIFVMLFIAGAELWQLFFLGGISVLGIIILSVIEPYRMRRFTAYFNPWADPQGAGFQLIQSLLAVGSGGWLGLGLGASRQKFFYLPQQFTDFIFAILCEETGLIGGIVVVILFAAFASYGYRIAISAPDPFKKLLAAGIVSWITLQALINVMVVLGLIPTTGIPLPFISYGGTATMINLFSIGIVLNVSRKS